MLEILNELPGVQLKQIDDFLSYLGIYDDYKRNQAFVRLIRSNYKLIKNKICVEAGAGLGLIIELLVKLGASKVFAVEENKLCYEFLKQKFKSNPKVTVVYEKIEKFKPPLKIDLLFHELYGPLLLDESILALERIRFKPDLVIPNSGRILIEEVKLKELNDPTINKKMLSFFKGALISDLFPYFHFRKPKILGNWRFQIEKKEYNFKYKIKTSSDLIALGMEIWHQNKRIIGTQDSFNWPYVFTPIVKTGFCLSFKYLKGFSLVYLDWF